MTFYFLRRKRIMILTLAIFSISDFNLNFMLEQIVNKNERDFAPWSQVHNLATCNLATFSKKCWTHFQLWQLSKLATFNFGNFQFWQKNRKCLTSHYINNIKIENVEHLTASNTSKRQIQKPVVWILRSKSSWPVTGLRSKGSLKDLNDSKLIVYESRINFILHIQNLQRSPIPQTNNRSGTFFLLFLTANRL